QLRDDAAVAAGLRAAGVRQHGRDAVGLPHRWRARLGGGPPDRRDVMRELEGQQVLVRIFMGESDQWRPPPLHVRPSERLRRAGFSGATVARGIAGFGAHSLIHTANILRLSQDLPVIVEVVDTEEQVERLRPILDEMVAEGLVTMEKVTVLRYRSGRA